MSEERVVLMDVDGVLTDFVPHLFSSIGTKLTPAQAFSWNLLEDVLPPEESEIGVRLLADPDWWRALPVIPGSQHGVERLRSQCDKMLFVTAPWVDCFGWESVRRAWLLQHFGVPHDDVVPLFVKQYIPGDAFIDDKSSNIISWAHKNPTGRAWLFDAPWNRSLQWADRVRWGDAGLERLVLDHRRHERWSSVVSIKNG